MYTLEDYLFVRNTRYIIWGIVALVVALLIFHAGFAIGSRRSMQGPPPQGGPGFFGAQLPHGYIADGHGAVGTVTSFQAPTLMVETRDDGSESVTVASTTLFDPQGSPSAELVQGAHVVIIGTPQDGGLVAKLIRVLPQ